MYLHQLQELKKTFAAFCYNEFIRPRLQFCSAVSNYSGLIFLFFSFFFLFNFLGAYRADEMN